jgi:polysaccharide biosynthesis/export protein
MKRNPILFLVLAGLLLCLSGGDVWASAVSPQGPPSQAKPPVIQAPPSQAKPASASQGQTGKPPATPAKPPSQTLKTQPPSVAPAPIVPAPPVQPPPGYVIGSDDVLQVLYWREKEVSAEVVVRPDGMISLPLLNDVKAAGLTPEQLREAVNEAAKKYFQEEPSVTINVKTINSRKVFITGSVSRPGPYPLTAPTTVLQLISMAGGLTEFANTKKISVMRLEHGKPVRYPFNYKDVADGKNLNQNIELKPGDTVIVR